MKHTRVVQKETSCCNTKWTNRYVIQKDIHTYSENPKPKNPTVQHMFIESMNVGKFESMNVGKAHLVVQHKGTTTCCITKGIRNSKTQKIQKTKNSKEMFGNPKTSKNTKPSKGNVREFISIGNTHALQVIPLQAGKSLLYELLFSSGNSSAQRVTAHWGVSANEATSCRLQCLIGHCNS